ncbi:hypothetical protein [Streptomyces sp. NPDC098781]|uniref:hypothetical protein n=1 Tax=Streptomyces sp. NPDC098781 TaxID=3366097 RepID=UPI0037F33ADD
MGTKTVDDTLAESKTDEENVDVTKTTDTEAEAEAEAVDVDGPDADEEVAAEATEDSHSDVGQGAGAVLSLALGFVSLTGSWIGTIATARENLLGQLENQSASQADVDKLIQAGYVDGWHAAALWAGLFAMAALIVGVVVLVRPAFGAPGKPQATWIKSVAWGGVAVGVVGLLLAVLKYTDVLLSVPSVG